MAYASLQNAAGNFVLPSAESFQSAAASADWKNAKDFYLVMTNAPGADAYPITATTFILMHKQPKDKAASDAALDFFSCALEKGQAQAKSSIMCRCRRVGAADRNVHRRQPSSDRTLTPSNVGADSSGAGGDAAVPLVTAGAAWLVLHLLGAAAVSMAWGGRLAFETFGWRFITSRDWDAVGGQVRRAGPDLRNARYVARSRC